MQRHKHFPQKNKEHLYEANAYKCEQREASQPEKMQEEQTI